MELRQYQKDCGKAIVNFIERDTGHGIVAACPAAGKSILIARTAEYLHKRGKRPLVLADRSKLIKQNYGKFSNPELVGIVSAGLGEADYGKPITIGGIQTLYNKAAQIGDVEWILIDECFVGDTLIDTPSGKKRIDSLRNGDVVLNACGIGAVSSVHVSATKQTIKLRLSNDTTIECTEDHPFFTINGWKEARALAIGEDLFSQEAMFELWQRIFSLDKETNRWQYKKSLLRSGVEKDKLLLSILLNEAQKPDEQECSQNKNERIAEKNKAQTNKSWREWEVVANSAISSFTRFRGRVDGGSGSKNQSRSQKRSLSELLQTGHCKRGFKNRNRGKRSNTLWETASHRQQKERTFSRVRVESVEHIKRESSTPIYNLRISGHPSYFANGVLVHNCHGVGNDFTSSTRYHQLIRAYPNARILGYSGTPYSLAEGAISWGKIIYEITYSELLKLGYVTPLTNKVADEPDLSNVKHSGAEYNLEALGNYMRQSELIEKAAQKTAHYIRANNRKKTLGFCVDVEHGFAMYEALRPYGFKIDMVHGSQLEDVRNIIYDSFEHGELDILLNVELITKGVDFPCIDCVAFYRPTESMALWEQAISRGIRLFEGKKECLLLDFTGNLRKFGTLGNPIWKYFGTEKKKVGKAQKICPACESSINIGKESCPDCGYIFTKEQIEKELKHQAEIDMQTDMSSSKNPERIYTVGRIEYSEHTSAKGRKSFRVTYWSGRFQVSEYIPFGQRYKRAIEQQIKFMRGRGSSIPESIEAALEECHQWRKPKVIQVQPQQGNPKYWELKGVIKWEEETSNPQSSANTLNG